MDVHGAGVVAVLGTVGAATGAISAVIVYTICARRRRLPLLNSGGGPLNWFEKDLLDRAEEAAKSSKDVFVGLSNSVSRNRDGKSPRNSDSRDEDEWRSHDRLLEETVDKKSSPGGRLLELLSESDDLPVTPVSPLAPPLPEGAVVASERRMVILKPAPRSLDSSQSRLSSLDIEPSHRLSSTSSASSAEFDEAELHLSISYDSAAGILAVKLHAAYSLPARELSGTANPYAKIRLLPDRSNVWQTKIHRRTLNPTFDEDFVFEVQPDSALNERTLEVLLYDFDAFSRHRGLGYVQVNLSEVDKQSETSFITAPIRRYGTGGFKAPPLGELMVSMSYQPSAEKLTVIIIKARNLPVVDDTSVNLDPYVKVVIVHEGKSLKKKKTGIRRKATSPVWNDTLTFDIGCDVLSECAIEFSVMRASGELMAKCEVSDKCQKDLYRRVLAGIGASAQWLPLSEPERPVEEKA